jgi:hypothetical protein
VVTNIFRWCVIQEFQLEMGRFNLINCVCVGQDKGRDGEK